MNWNIATLKGMAKNALTGSYWKSVFVGFLMMLCTATASSGSARGAEQVETNVDTGIVDQLMHNPYFGVISAMIAAVALLAGIAGLALQIFVMNPLEIGIRRYFMEDLYAPCELDRVTYGFKMNYVNGMIAMLLRAVFTALWTMLLIIPGIIKSYEYRMIPYLLAENPDMEWREAFSMSKRMMDGEKWNAFVLDLSFLGWQLLSIITCGLVGIFYVNPYKGLTDAALYMALREKIMLNPQGI
ncbi:MAG: DUF975 family protein [Lachnospiraceae bacterium]|jgi:uncharacterized membrane protein|nr:DUF975 family protein [Lachnospiraceae bacterium]